MHCDFQPALIPVMWTKVSSTGAPVMDERGGPIFEEVLDPSTGEVQTQPAYKVRFVGADGAQILLAATHRLQRRSGPLRRRGRGWSWGVLNQRLH